MNTYKFVLLLIVTVLLSSACTNRFYADFEADTVGSLPNAMPESSADDSIFVFSGTGNVEVSDNNPITDTKSLIIAGPTNQLSAYNKVVFMYSEEIGSRDQRLYASWIGRTSNGASTIISFYGRHYYPLVNIEFSNGNIIVFDNIIGRYNFNEKHHVFIYVDPNSDTYNFSILDAANNEISASGNIPNSSTLPARKIGLSFSLEAGSSSDFYQIDTISMSEKKP